MLIKNFREKGGDTGKLWNFCESNVFVVEVNGDNLPVFKLRNIHKRSDVSRVHVAILKRNVMICLLTFSNLFYPPNNPKRSNQMEVLDDFDNSDENMVIIHGTDDMEDKTNAEHCASINDPYSVHNIDSHDDNNCEEDPDDNDSMVCEADSASDTKESENEIEHPKRIVRKKCFSHTITLEVLEV